ncbi:MAG: HAD family hydrolase [Thermoplasmata archaeon]
MSIRPDNSGQRPAAIIFDLFHTLVDPEEFRPRTFLRGPFLAEQLGLESEPFVEYWRNSYVERARHREPSVRERIRVYCNAIGREVPDSALNSAIDGAGRYQDLALEKTRPEIVAALRSIRRHGTRVGLLSNCDEMEVRRWSSSPLADCFDFVGFSCDLGHIKPERQAYEAVRRGLGDIPASRCIFVGDGSADEFVGARDAEIRLVVFMRGFVGQNGMRSPPELERLEGQADYTVDQLSEVESLQLT